MLRTSITLSCTSGTSMLGATATCESVFSAQVRNCSKFPVGQTPIIIESEGESIDLTFLQGHGAFQRNAQFALTGFLTATIQPETGDVIITGTGKWLAATGCRIVPK